MKRKIKLSIALALSIVVVLLTNSDSLVEAQNQMRFVADTGVVTLGSNQVLRIEVVNYRETDFNVRFRRMEYVLIPTNGGVWKLAVASQTALNPAMLMPGEAVSIDIPSSGAAVRGIVNVNNREALVNMMIIDTATGNIVSFSNTDLDDSYR